ncbi:MAG: sulfotransferase domain-containing protein [Candidatus Binatia bacterium]
MADAYTNIFVACFPKSGSTYICTLLSEVTGFPHVPVVQFYGQNEQDLFEPALQQVRGTSSVTQQHVKGTNNNVRLLKTYNLRPVVLVRNIFDVVVSLHDHFMREDTLTPVGYVHREYQAMSREDRLWFLINLHLPWYFHFLVSWQEATTELDLMWLTYEDFFANPVTRIQQVLQFYDMTASDDEIRQGMIKLAGKNARLNVGVVGRGKELPDCHRQAVIALARTWHLAPDRLSLIGMTSESLEQTSQRVNGSLPPTPRKPLWLDLGCGTVKQASFIGLDRYQLPGVDIIVDLNRPLPFRDGSVDLVYASHSLEHVDDLLAVMQEIYRICKPGAQVCIVAPYHNQSLNLANPYHRQVFNEHTPRFWTNAPAVPIAAEEFTHPHTPAWGLKESDASTPNLDFRCLKLEFFYFPQYRNLPLEEQRQARQKYLDVCDQIMFHLLVVKPSMSEAEVRQAAAQLSYYEPPFVTLRQLRERIERQEQTEQELRQALAVRATEMEQLQMAVTAAQERTAELEAQGEMLRETLRLREQEATELQQLRNAQATDRDELMKVRTAFAAARQEWQQATVTREAELRQLSESLTVAHQQLARCTQYQYTAADELTRFRRHRLTRWFARLRRGDDLRQMLAPRFQQLLDDSLLFTDNLKRFRLQPSEDLRFVQFLLYPLVTRHAKLHGLLLAPILDFPALQGKLGVEIVSPANTIVAQSVVPLDHIDEQQPTCLQFSPVVDLHDGQLWLRVFVRDAVAPVRVFEWRRYGVGGLGHLHTRAFCGFLFPE